MLKDNSGDFLFYKYLFLYGWVGHMMDCTAEALDKVRREWRPDNLSLTHPPSTFSWRCTIIATCPCRGACGRLTRSAI